MKRLFEIHTLLSSMRKSKVLKFKILFDIEFFSSNRDFLIRKIKEPELNFNIFSNILYSEQCKSSGYIQYISLPFVNYKIILNHTLCLLDTTSKGSSSPASLANLGGSQAVIIYYLHETVQKDLPQSSSFGGDDGSIKSQDLFPFFLKKRFF